MNLHLEKPIYGGACLGRLEGKAIFVPMTLPGEEVEAAIVKDKGSFAEAELVQVLQPSPDRVHAPCPYYGACGGCQYQHAGYAAQLAMKRSVLGETLERAGLCELPEVAVHAGEPWGYRNRIRLHLNPAPDPATHALGYRRRGSLALLPVETCPIAAPVLQAAIPLLHRLTVQGEAGRWCEGMELFTNHDSSAVLLSVAQRTGAAAPQNGLARLCEALQGSLPALTGAAVFRAAIEPAARKGRRPPVQEDSSGAGTVQSRWGAASLRYNVGAGSYRVSTGAFFQANRFLVSKLVELATGSNDTETDERGRLAWDLFAGVGLFAQALAQRFERVTAVEGAPISAADLAHNLPAGHHAKHHAGHQIVESSTLGFLQRQAGKRERPSLVVLDPPRAGLGAPGAALLAQVRSQNVTYVSCDPATLARDLKVLVDAGYTITQLHLVDLFPQTFHLETVVKLRLR